MAKAKQAIAAAQFSVPAIRTGQKVQGVVLKKIDAGGNAITVSGGIIDGSTSAAIYSQQWASQDFLSDGTQWYQV
jgi:hypothetical protein